jgi:hypothetical protein
MTEIAARFHFNIKASKFALYPKITISLRTVKMMIKNYDKLRNI